MYSLHTSFLAKCDLYCFLYINENVLVDLYLNIFFF